MGWPAIFAAISPVTQVSILGLAAFGLFVGLFTDQAVHKNDKRDGMNGLELMDSLLEPGALMGALTANYTARPWMSCIDASGVQRPLGLVTPWMLAELSPLLPATNGTPVHGMLNRPWLDAVASSHSARPPTLQAQSQSALQAQAAAVAKELGDAAESFGNTTELSTSAGPAIATDLSDTERAAAFEQHMRNTLGMLPGIFRFEKEAATGSVILRCPSNETLAGP